MTHSINVVAADDNAAVRLFALYVRADRREVSLLDAGTHRRIAFDGDYEYFVHLYAGLGRLGGSGATVQVYTRGCEVKTFAVPRDCAQRVWSVGSLHNGGGRVEFTNQQRREPGDASPMTVKEAIQALLR